MLLVIMANAVVIFLLNFPHFEHNPFLLGLDHFFLGIFIVEAIVKIRVFSWRKYWKDPWNRFDFVVLILSLPSLLVGLIAVPDTSAVLSLRMFRMIRLLRFFRFIPHIGLLLEGMLRAIKSSVFVLLSFAVITFLLSLFTCTIFKEAAPEYFGNPLISAYSIFQLFTIEGWNDISTAIADQHDASFGSFFVRLYFVLIVLGGGMFGMSFVTAIFVDEMTIDNNRELEKKIDVLTAQVDRLEHLLKEQKSTENQELDKR